MNLLEIRNLTHIFPDGTKAVDNISFEINPGDFIVITGRNGSGKTVLLRHLNGLYKPSGGDVLFRGRSIYRGLREVRRQVGMVFQDADSQIVSQTVWGDTVFGPLNLGLDKTETAEKAEAALKAVGLSHLKNHSPRNLSGGEKRRLAIAGVLAMDPSVILLDEPFSNLDYPGIRDVIENIIALHRAGHTIVCVTHELEKILKYATRMIILENGKLSADTSPGEGMILCGESGITPKFASDSDDPGKILDTMTWLK